MCFFRTFSWLVWWALLLSDMAAAPPPVVQTGPTPYAMEDAFPGLNFVQPLAIVTAPGDKDRLFVVEKTGRVQVITGLNGPQPTKKLFLDLTSLRYGALDVTGECGLLGLAFPPDHARSGHCFVYYSLKTGKQLNERLSRFQMRPDDPDRADATTEQALFTQEDKSTNHNGGDLHFGPDGFLYVSLGDGGAANDQLNQARFINKGFHAAILRIDVRKQEGSLPPNFHSGIAHVADGTAFYAVPADNPFIGATSYHGETIDPKTVRTEMWATGLRNPWRISFDQPTGRLFAGDVGQNLYEEVDLIVKGGDYGWSYREGMHPFPQGPGKDQEPAGFHPIEPIYEYPHPRGVCVIGGVVYRGKAFPELNGDYVFADYGTGLIMALHEKDSSWTAELLAREAAIAGIGVDPRNGEVLFANLAQGRVKRLLKN